MIEITSVAGIAPNLCVRTPERIFRVLVVVEEYRGPFILIVTSFAFSTVATEVNVLNRVAIDARGPDPLVTFADVAG